MSCRRPFWVIAVTIPALLAALLPAQAKRKGTQYALLVACSGYNKNHLPPLPYTIKELQEFRDVLVESGYEPDNIKFLHDKQTNPERYLPETEKIRRELTRLLERAGEDDSVVVAFSGHGIHFLGDKGYFCPLNARLGDKKTLLPMDEVFERLKKCAAGRKLLLMNACRNDPAVDPSQATLKLDLDNETRDEVPKGIAALYSCKPGQKSYYYREDDERTKGRKRSLFFHHVIETWKGAYSGGEGSPTVDDLFREVKRRTGADADKFHDESQTPTVYRKYEGEGEWLLRGRVRVALERTVTVDLGGGVKMEFVRIPAGKFRMGSPKDEKERGDDEEQHAVEITRAFYLGKYEVTQEQYQQMVGTNPSYFSAGGWGKGKVKDVDTRRFPVECVSWEEATAFCAKLLARDGQRRFRLPTEAEWEYACRAGTATPFHFGSALNGDKANCDGHSPYGTDEKGRYLETTCGVGSYPANALGLYDMHGNVGEWCQDWYGPYSGLADKDPLRTEKADKDARVLRGGSRHRGARDCRAANRDGGAPGGRGESVGFRVGFRLD